MKPVPSSWKDKNWLEFKGFRSIHEKLPKNYFFNAVVVIILGLFSYWIGIVPESVAPGLWGLVWMTLTTSVNFIFFSTLTDVLIKRSEGKPVTFKSLLGAAGSGFFSGVITFIFFVIISPFPGLVRTLLVMFILVYVRNYIYSLLFHVEGKKMGLVAKHRDDIYWLGRPVSFLKNGFIQWGLPLAARGPVEAVLHSLFHLVEFWACHQLHRKTIIRKEHWVSNIQRVVRWRGPALIAYTCAIIPYWGYEGWLMLKEKATQPQMGSKQRDSVSLTLSDVSSVAVSI